MNSPQTLSELLASLKHEAYCYLTTVGRVTGRPHEIEIWFGLKDTTLYLMSGGGERSDWVKNLKKTPTTAIRIQGRVFHATARIVTDETEQASIRPLLADKYNEREADGSLSEWAQTALVVGFDVAEVQA
jgi:deazaflavin-dependent oxidoreductase (nitroreductase family)